MMQRNADPTSLLDAWMRKCARALSNQSQFIMPCCRIAAAAAAEGSFAFITRQRPPILHEILFARTRYIHNRDDTAAMLVYVCTEPASECASHLTQ